MSALSAEIIEIEFVAYDRHLHVVSEPEVIALTDLPQDELLQARAERFIRDIGGVAVAEEVEQTCERAHPNDSLLTAIKRGAEGDTEAQQMISINVGSDFSERVLKTGEVTKIYLQENQEGELTQHGQTFTSIYANTLSLTPRESKMRARTEAETVNAHRINFWHNQGLLKENYAVVWSACADDMTDKELDKAGFFSSTKTLAVQASTTEENGVSVESAFMAGVKEKNKPRHDIDTIVSLAESLGLDYSDMTASEIINTPMLIPKSMMKGGVIDLVEMYDDVAGGTFFGEDKPRQDYLEYRKFCDERRKSFSADVAEVTQQLLSESDQLYTKQQAIDRLNKLSGAQMARRAIKDLAIKPDVFGAEAAAHIEHARQQINAGNYLEAQLSENKAVKTEASSSCPSGVGRQSVFDEADKATDSINSSEDKYGSLNFNCPKGHKNTRPRNKLIEKCKTCGTSVKC